MKVLVTGADGFVGAYLGGALHARGDVLIPVCAQPRTDFVVRYDEDPVTVHPIDAIVHDVELPDLSRLREIVRKTKPDAVVHLAAVSAVPDSSRAPDHARRVNVEGTADLVEALVTEHPTAHLLFVSSCLVYGPTPVAEQPVDEATTVRPNNEYGRTKLAAEEVVLAARERFAVPPTVVRPFNHFGPGQSPNFVLASFARQVERIRAGLAEPVLRTGNLDVRREFLDVRDVVSAYLALLDRPGIGEVFTVASGTPHRLRALVDRLATLGSVEFSIETDPTLLRKNDLEVLSGSARRLTEATGWTPRRTIDESLSVLLQYWREQVQVEQRGNGDAVRG